jgi:hypothetical protein
MKRVTVTVATTWALVSSFALSAGAQVSPEYRAAVRRMMEVTGSAQLGSQFGAAVVESMSKTMRSARPDLPPRAFEVLQEVSIEVIDESIPDLFDDTAAIYANHFTLSEIEQMNAFYETPVGRKAISVMPALLGEAIEMGKAWAAELQPVLQARLMERLVEEGLLPAEALQEAR